MSNLHVLVCIQTWLGVGCITYDKSGHVFVYTVYGKDCLIIINLINGLVFTPVKVRNFVAFLSAFNEKFDTNISFIPCKFSIKFLFNKTEFLLGLMESDGSFSANLPVRLSFAQKFNDMSYFLQNEFFGSIRMDEARKE